MRGMMRNLPKLVHVMVPVPVLGGQRDGTVTIEELHSTARAYRTTAEVFPNMGHDMMLEPGWPRLPNESTTGSPPVAYSPETTHSTRIFNPRSESLIDTPRPGRRISLPCHI